jgi:stress-induced morphogen|eukprot:COSAG01_NODE_1567_length_9877_cov_8.690939_7_plen_167_part_00
MRCARLLRPRRMLLTAAPLPTWLNCGGGHQLPAARHWRLLSRDGTRPAAAATAPAAAQFYGPVQQEVERKLMEGLQPLHLTVTNESHGAVENESHFHVLVVAEQFQGKLPLAQHRLVNQLLAGEDGQLPFHSLRITTQTPAQWGDGETVPVAPTCKGGDGLKGARA